MLTSVHSEAIKRVEKILSNYKVQFDNIEPLLDSKATANNIKKDILNEIKIYKYILNILNKKEK